MTADRRPRIPAALADKIDLLREDTPFERYIANVLERHVGHELGTHDDDYQRERHGERRHTYTDPEGAVLYVDKPSGEGHDLEDVIGALVVDDEDYDPVGIYLTEQGVRGLRDVCTELLGEWEGYR